MKSSISFAFGNSQKKFQKELTLACSICHKNVVRTYGGIAGKTLLCMGT
jgi:hypothetical protein